MAPMISSTPALCLPEQASDFEVLTVHYADLIKQQLPLSILWSRAKDQWGMVESWQPTGANDVTLGTESGEYQGTNKSAEGVKHLSLVHDYDLFTTGIIVLLTWDFTKDDNLHQHLNTYHPKFCEVVHVVELVIKTINMTQQQLMILLKHQSKLFL